MESLKMDFPPLVTITQFTSLFSAMLVRHEQQLSWSRVRALKAALTHWHQRRHMQCILDCWADEMSAFWRGFAQLCTHTSKGKQPIEFDAVVDVLEAAVLENSVIGIRNAAMIATAFFGVRRGAEVVAFRMSDIQVETHLGVRLKVRCQKNDRLGLGQVCLLPNINALGPHSPLAIFKRWLQLRKQLVEEVHDLPIFVDVTGGQQRVRRLHRHSQKGGHTHVRYIDGHTFTSKRRCAVLRALWRSRGSDAESRRLEKYRGHA